MKVQSLSLRYRIFALQTPRGLKPGSGVKRYVQGRLNAFTGKLWGGAHRFFEIFAKFRSLGPHLRGACALPQARKSPEMNELASELFKKIKNYRKRFTELGDRASQRPSIERSEMEF